MKLQSINPASGEIIAEYPEHSPEKRTEILNRAAEAFPSWRDTPVAGRARLMQCLAEQIRNNLDEYAVLITREMGKRIAEARSELERCASLCEHTAQHAPAILAEEVHTVECGRAVVAFEPLGAVLAVMPWNFPFWQVLRFALPVMAAGNVVVLKHAANICGCAMALEKLFLDAGFPENVFQAVFTVGSRVEDLIKHPIIRGVSLTGSVYAGRKLAEAAGRHLKKTVMELGGSDPFIVLADADLDKAAKIGVASRFRGCGQVCAAAKRFIVVEDAADAFIQKFADEIRTLVPGDPMDQASGIGPMAREDLLEILHGQVERSMDKGARLVLGGRRVDRPGFFYEPTLLVETGRGMPVFDEEVFGPVAAVTRAAGVEEAISLANDTVYGLGASLWTRDEEQARSLATRLEAGAVTINAMPRSEICLPFGGVKHSGWGRELSPYGFKEFVNIKTIRIGGENGHGR